MAESNLLHKAIDNAKKFENFNDVVLAVSLHPEWLTFIPPGRKWAILHQIILSGDVDHLNQVLALQRSNRDFRLLTDTNDGKTVLDIARSRKDAPEMKARIEQLIKLDEMLTYARDGQWDQCYNIVRENPAYFNEKTPYRRYYLIHHMACANAVDEYKRFKQIKGCTINPTLRVDNMKVNELARNKNCLEFAKLIEKEYSSLLDNHDSDIDEISKPSKEALQQTKAVTLMMQKSVVKDLDESLLGNSQKPKSRAEVMQHISEIRTDRRKTQDQKDNASAKVDEDKQKSLLMDNLTCPLTLNIFIDPGKSFDEHYLNQFVFFSHCFRWIYLRTCSYNKMVEEK
jgi:hypothetical protein